MLKTFCTQNTNFSNKLEVCLTRLEKLNMDKNSSLLQTFVNYGLKKFNKIETRQTETRRGQFGVRCSERKSKSLFWVKGKSVVCSL